MLICGPTGVGKSTIGFELYLSTLRAGLKAGYVDLDQVNSAGTEDPGHHRLKSANLATIWRTYRAAGASHVVATRLVHDVAVFRRYTDALPGAAITLCPCRTSRTDPADFFSRRRRAAGRNRATSYAAGLIAATAGWPT